MKYSDVAALMQSGDMIEFDSNAILGRLIKFFTGKKRTHTAGVEGTMGQTQNFLIEANAPGIELETAIRDFSTTGSKIYWTPLLRKYDGNRKAIADFWLSQVGCPYNYQGLFSNILGHINATVGKYICSIFYFVGLVEGAIFPTYSVKCNEVVDLSGKAVPGPRPGEMTERFPEIFGDTVEIVL